MQKVRIGIDLLWVRPGKVGGTESFINNLLLGFQRISEEGFFFNLFCARDNAYAFEAFLENNRISITRCNMSSEAKAGRIIYENVYLDRLAQKNNIDIMYIPVYSMPHVNGKVPYVVTIHDLQALHFPEFFSLAQKVWLKLSWERSIRNASHLVAISDFVRKDILAHYKADENRISVIYNPIVYTKSCVDFKSLEAKYNIKRNDYLYTISSLLPHKNLITLLKMLSLTNEKNQDKGEKIFPSKLVITGIAAGKEKEFFMAVKALGVEDSVVLTGFVPQEERNALLENASVFLFPSLFEGFGMPLIEAMMAGTKVITTKCASIPEITDWKAYYVDDPLNPQEWLCALDKVNDYPFPKIDFSKYSIEKVSCEYINLFKRTLRKNKVLCSP